MGVDFFPYLQRVRHAVANNWYAIIPEAAQAPLFKRGVVTVEFVIMKDGTIKGMHLSGSSQDISLDRAAWGGIVGSNPLPPLPKDFRGEYIGLRFKFYYNPEHGDLR